MANLWVVPGASPDTVILCNDPGVPGAGTPGSGAHRDHVLVSIDAVPVTKRICIPINDIPDVGEGTVHERITFAPDGDAVRLVTGIGADNARDDTSNTEQSARTEKYLTKELRFTFTIFLLHDSHFEQLFENSTKKYFCISSLPTAFSLGYTPSELCRDTQKIRTTLQATSQKI